MNMEQAGISRQVAAELSLGHNQVVAVQKVLAEGASVPS